VAGHKRFRAGAWRLTVEGPPDPITGKRQQVYRTVREPNTRAGAKAADIELSKLVVEVDAQRVLPSSGVTVGQLMERWVAHRRPGWEERSPGQPDATLARIRDHITPKLGNVAVDRLRPIDVDNLYASWRATGMSESTVRRMHAILHAALTQAVRWDLIVFTRAETPDGSKPWHPDGANQRFNRIRERVPGAEKITLHQLRRWMATSMFADGYDPVHRRRP
jgi:hypothetical protein